MFNTYQWFNYHVIIREDLFIYHVAHPVRRRDPWTIIELRKQVSACFGSPHSTSYSHIVVYIWVSLILFRGKWWGRCVNMDEGHSVWTRGVTDLSWAWWMIRISNVHTWHMYMTLHSHYNLPCDTERSGNKSAIIHPEICLTVQNCPSINRTSKYFSKISLKCTPNIFIRKILKNW